MDQPKNGDVEKAKNITTTTIAVTPPKEQSSGIPWVAVHGVEQICVIIVKTYEVVGRSSLPATGIGRKVLSSFTEKVVAETEAIESRQLIDQRFKKGPFAVVSVVRNPDPLKSSSEAPWATSDAEQCINFLVVKLKDASDISYNNCKDCNFCNVVSVFAISSRQMTYW